MSQRDWLEKDYYKVLGVSKTASKNDIKKAYRRLAQKYHPDANKGDPSAEARFKEISEAHAVLSNEDKRKEYDQMRSFVEAGGQRFYGYHPGAGQGNVRVNIGDLGDLRDLFGEGGGFGGMFDDLFGGFGGRRQAQRGSDLETETRLTFEQAMYGTTVTLPQGAKVRIPPGIGDGARIRVAGKGEPGPNGGPSGDLYVKVAVEPHPFFTVTSDGHLMVRVPVTFTEAALGANIDVPTLDGSVTVKIPPGTENGKTLRVRGKGPPGPRGQRRDLLVKVEVEVPKKLSRQERDLLERFADIHKASPRTGFEKYVGKPRSGAKKAS